jgi:hypothetical protein
MQISAYRKGSTVRASAEAAGDFVVNATGGSFHFGEQRVEAFIRSNSFGPRLANALHGLEVGEALMINGAQLRLVVSRPNGNTATIVRRFKLTREIF